VPSRRSFDAPRFTCLGVAAAVVNEKIAPRRVIGSEGTIHIYNRSPFSPSNVHDLVVPRESQILIFLIVLFPFIFIFVLVLS
jgi:hypothetical protein